MSGNCLEMLNEPPESSFAHKVKAVTYPCVERNGAVWTYMGPENAPPPLPDIEANMADGFHTLAMEHDHNWLQVLEGTIDTVHAGILHAGSTRWEDLPEGTFRRASLQLRSAKFEVIDTDGGVCYGAHRPAERLGWEYWRIAYFIFPFYGMSPTGGGFQDRGSPVSLTAAVPMDDEHTLYFHFIAKDRSVSPWFQEEYDLLPNSTDWYGRFRPEAQANNDFLLDREVQRQSPLNSGGSGFSGIPTVRHQDRAITSSMGTIYDRTHEHLGQTDLGLIRTRKRLIEAVVAFAETGVSPPGVRNPEAYRVRGGEAFLPANADWVEATEEVRQAFKRHSVDLSTIR